MDTIWLERFSMSAIGHESDFLLSDLVADLRASTRFKRDGDFTP